MSNSLNEWKKQALKSVFGSGTKAEELATLSGREVEMLNEECNQWKRMYELQNQEILGVRAQLEEYEPLNVMQLEAGARAAKLYKEKHGTDIGQLDLALGTVFLMEQNDELRAHVVVLRECIEKIKEKHINPVNHNKYPSTTAMCLNALATTPAEDVKRVRKLVAALEEAKYWLNDSGNDVGDGSVLLLVDKDLAAWKGERA